MPISIHWQAGSLDIASFPDGVEAPLRKGGGAKRVLEAAVGSGRKNVLDQSGLLYPTKALKERTIDDGNLVL